MKRGSGPRRDGPGARRFAESRSELKTGTDTTQAFLDRGRRSSAQSLERSGRESPKQGGRKRAAISPASQAQREKARTEPCVVTGQEAIEGAIVDPAHLWPRGKGGCDSPLCTVPLVRHYHRHLDDGNFDLLPYLVGRRVPELCHALEHADGDILSLLHRLTGQRYSPSEAAA